MGKAFQKMKPVQKKRGAEEETESKSKEQLLDFMIFEKRENILFGNYFELGFCHV